MNSAKQAQPWRKALPMLAACIALTAAAEARAQRPPPPPPVPDGPINIDLSDNVKLSVNVVTRGLVHPWALAFMPNGDMLVTERPGRVRIIRNGVLDPTPVATMEVATTFALSGLMDIALHPKFAENGWVYLTYNKPGPNNGRIVTLARGKWDGSKIAGINDLVVTDTQIGAARITFGPDGALYFVVGGPPGPADDEGAQDTTKSMGKVFKLNDEGKAAPGSPFTKPGDLPGLFSIGHRNSLGLAFNPYTNELWETEDGPQGGDEVNIVKAGKNYGWPDVSFGRWYDGPRVSQVFTKEGTELPLVFWTPAIATSGMTFYTNARTPQWRRNLFVGSMMQGRTNQTGHIERIVFNTRWEEIKREPFLFELKQRIREVREGPDGALYVLTDEDAGVLMKMTPTDVTPRPAPAPAPAPR